MVHGNTDLGVQISTALRIQNEKIQKAKTPNIQKSKNLRIHKSIFLQGSADVKSFGLFLIFSVFSFLDFFGFWVLQLCFQSVEADPQLDSQKGSVCVGIYSVLKGCACRWGVTIYVYIYIYI